MLKNREHLDVPIRYVKWISRDLVQSEPEARFVFGDNARRIGYGGQAKAMRDEPNAIGIATKRSPSMMPQDFFADKRLDDFTTMTTDLSFVQQALDEGRDVYVPVDGLGTGLSQLPDRAPKLYKVLYDHFAGWSEPSDPCPWPKP